MIDIQVIEATNLISTAALNSSSSKTGSAPSLLVCVLKLAGREIFRTRFAAGYNPQWNTSYQVSSSLLSSRSKEHYRPYFLEYLDIDVVDFTKNPNYGEKIFEARIPLINVGKTLAYRLLRVNTNKETEDVTILENISEARILIGLSKLSIPHDDSNWFPDDMELKRLQLHQVLAAHLPQFQHLYMNFDDWTYGSMLGCGVLPGPRLGEIVIDKHEAEWVTTTGINAFGDRTSVISRGSLFITDLRVIFIPSEIIGPSWMDSILNLNLKINGNLNADQILVVRKFTIQIPLSSIQGMRYLAENLNSTALIFESKDGSIIEFKIRRYASRRSETATQTSTPQAQGNRSNSVDINISIDKSRLLSPLYRSGLDSEDIIPQVWCSRVVEEINWRIRDDLIWLSWMKYLKETCDKYFPVSESVWLKNVRQVIDIENEFQRLRIQDNYWMFCDLNTNYDLCSTYPRTVIVPGILSNSEVIDSASHRSRGRIASLVWIHPTSKAPLCRSAQPMSGMAGSSNESDRKFLLAIKASCPSGLPLRIADARPRVNANVNAMQGKGFENIAFLGGPKNASLAFLDIENIHVMRSSYMKLKEGLMLPGVGGGTESTSDVVSSSKWYSHVAGLIRGAVSIAESIVIGHPVLLHCSDGWDRTGQLSALTQLLLDPYYRTIQGFFILINKDFCSYGFRFESRCGKLSSNSKEASPIFFQFLDSVNQLILQFPTSFEFTSTFLIILSQAMYSGYFTSFRGNCEKERTLYIKQSLKLEKIDIQDSEYSTVFCYFGILLRCPSYARLMVNSCYVAMSSIGLDNVDGFSIGPKSFLRPKYSVNDMCLWREGFFGYVPDISSHLTRPSISSLEHEAIQTHGYSRLLSYLHTQSAALDPNVVSRIEGILHFDGYLSNPSAVIPYQLPWNPTSLSFRKQHAKIAVSQSMDSRSNMTRKQILSSARIFVWYRAEKDLKKSWNSLSVEYANLTPNLVLLLKQMYRGLLQAEYRLKMKLKWMNMRYTSTWIRGIVDDLVEKALVRCIRSDTFILPHEALEAAYSIVSIQASQTNTSMISKSITNKFKGWTNSSKESVAINTSPLPNQKRNGNTSKSSANTTFGYSFSSNSSLGESDNNESRVSIEENSMAINIINETPSSAISAVMRETAQPERQGSPEPFDPLSGFLDEPSKTVFKTVTTSERGPDRPASIEKQSFTGKMMNMLSNVKTL